MYDYSNPNQDPPSYGTVIQITGIMVMKVKWLYELRMKRFSHYLIRV